MAPENTSIASSKLRQARRLESPSPARPNTAGNTNAYRGIPPPSRVPTAAMGEGVWVWICMTLVPGVQVSAPPAIVVQAAGTLTGVKVQIALMGRPEQERLT